MTVKHLLYDSQYIPPEWIAAHGFTPERLIPRAPTPAAPLRTPELLATLASRMGVCTYAASAVIEAAGGDECPVVVTTLCDQMRRAGEVLQEEQRETVFIFNMPRTWQSSAALAMYRAEIMRLGRFLETLGGCAPHPGLLAEVMDEYERKRECPSTESSERAGPGIALVGGPMTDEESWIGECIRAAGGAVVLDATETGELALVPRFERRGLREDPFAELLFAYFSLPHPARRPNDYFYGWLSTRLAVCRVKGIVFVRHLWCDIWHAELARVREQCSLPVAELDTSGQAGARPRSASRIQSLLEMLR